MKGKILIALGCASLALYSCKKEGCTDKTALNYSEKAKKDDGSCTYTPPYVVPTSYQFVDGNNVSTVDYAGQTERINQFEELMTYAAMGENTVIFSQNLRDMFANVGGNGNGQFTFTSTRQLKDKMFAIDTTAMLEYFDGMAATSNFASQTASNGTAGVLTSGSSKYLFDANGKEYLELIEKGFLGGVFMYQSLNVYFGPSKMNVDNTAIVAGKNYTLMQHHWDEAFGYFGVPVDFPMNNPNTYWAKYCNNQNTALGCNSLMMNNFIKGRAAIGANILTDRDDAIQILRVTWEDIAAYQAMSYLTGAVNNFGTDQGKSLHNINEAYALIRCLRYAPLETRRMTNAEIDALLASFGTNFWNLSVINLNTIKTSLDTKY